jgi:hypothetical protein
MKIVLLVGAALAATLLALSARATVPPVGQLPKVMSIQVEHGQLFALALPKPAKGYIWRGPKNTKVDVATPLYVGALDGNPVLLYEALKVGKTTIAYWLTKGARTKAYKSEIFQVTVT